MTKNAEQTRAAALDSAGERLYNLAMNLLCLEAYVVGISIAVVAVQYGLALFCLIKLAFLDIPTKHYVLWNLFILLVFFVGDIAFIIYYYTVGKNKKIPPFVPAALPSQAEEKSEGEKENEGEEQSEQEEEK